MCIINVIANLAALVVGALVWLFLRDPPIEAYGPLWEGASGNSNAVSETLAKATPLLLVDLGICIAFRAGGSAYMSEAGFVEDIAITPGAA